MAVPIDTYIYTESAVNSSCMSNASSLLNDKSCDETG